MPVLHHHPLSAASRYVRLVFAEYGEEPMLLEQEPWQRSDSILALNPAGTLPILEDDNRVVISDGAVIAEYLFETRGQRLGETVLLPSDAAERAEARRLVAWFGDKMNREVTGYLIHEKVFKRLMPVGEGGGAPDSTAIRAARGNIRYHLNYIGYLAERRNWLAGRALSLADFAAAAELSCIDYLGEVPWEENEKAKAWYARIKSRPSFRPVLADIVRGAPPSRDYANLDF